jgi:hypothetical protein
MVIAGVMLSAPAFLNGFPLVFYDSSSYVVRAAAVTRMPFAHHSLAGDARAQSPAHGQGSRDDGALSPYKRISKNPIFLRPIFYSLFLAPLAFPVLFFLVPVVQGAVTGYVIWRVLACLGLARAGPFLVSILALAAASSLPIHVSYVMPDLFTSLMILMVAALTLSWPRRSWRGRALDVALIAGFASIHLSHLPILLGLIGAYVVGALLFWRRQIPLGRLAASAGATLCAFGLAVSGLVGSNVALGHKVTLSESSPLFMMARLVGDGPAVAYLQRACPTRHYLVCSQLSNLRGDADDPPGDRFLWSPDGAVKQLASPRLLKEAKVINAATMKAYPEWIAANAARNALRQLVTFQINAAVNTPPPAFVLDTVGAMGPGLRAPLASSAQARAAIPLEALRLLTNVVLAAAAVAIVVIVARWRRLIPSATWQFLYIAAAGLLVNALATGGLSTVHDRYQNRVIWIVPLAAIVLALTVYRSRTSAR